MKRKRLLFAVALVTGMLGWNNIQAQTDVTSTYITNAGFEDCPAFGSGNAAAVSAAAGTDYAEYGWTLTKMSGWSNSAVFEYGSGGQINGATVPSSDPKGNAGKGLAFSQGWGGDNLYRSIAVTLPAGTYTLVAPVYNALQDVTQMTSKIGFVPTNGGSFISTRNSYAYNTWTLDMVEFTLTEPTEGQFQVGFQAISGGSGSNAKLIVDGLILYDGVYNAELIANKERLEGSSFTNPSADLLINGSFDAANTGWTLNNMGYQANQERPTRYVEKWQGSALTGSGSAAQTVKNLPAGAYILKGTVNTNKDENGGATLNVNDASIPVSGTWKEYEIIYNLEEDGNVTVAFNWSGLNSNWIAIDGFSLVYGGPYAQYMADKETLGHKKDWDDALAAAQAALENADYSNVSGDELVALQAEIAKEEPTTAQGYDDATAALNAATTAFIDAAPSYNAWVAIVQLVNETGELQYADSSKKPSTEATISNAADASANAASLTKALRAYYESHALAEGVDVAENMTNIIANANNPSNNDGWTWTGSKNNPASNEPWTDANETNSHSYFDGGNWGQNSWTTTMSQTISLPAGRYLLTAKARAAENVTFTMAVGGNSVNLPHVGNAGNVFDRGWGDASVEFETSGEDATILVSASSNTLHEWFSISDFRLVQLEEIVVPMADDDDYAALTTAITNAEAKTLGFDEDEYAPYNNVAALQALAAAKAIDPDNADGNTKEVVQSVTSDLDNAEWTANTEEVNAIFDGGFETDYSSQPGDNEGRKQPIGWYRVQGTNGDGYNVRYMGGSDAGLAATSTGKALFTKFAAFYGWADGYTMPLNENTYYEVTFVYGGWSDCKKDGYVTITDPQGNNIELSIDRLPLDAVDGNSNPDSWKQYRGVFKTGDAGNYVLGLRKDNENQQSQYVYGDFNLVKATPTTIDEGVELAAGKYATRIYPFAPQAIEGITFYSCAGMQEGKATTLALTEVSEPQALVPYILGNDAEGATEAIGIEQTGVDIHVNDTYTEGYLTGIFAQTTVPEGSYVLQTLNEKQAFYKVEGEFTINTLYRAYLTMDSDVKAFNLGVDDATAINALDALTSGAYEGIYSVDGVKLNRLEKGVNILKMADGTTRKVVVK